MPERSGKVSWNTETGEVTGALKVDSDHLRNMAVDVEAGMELGGVESGRPQGRKKRMASVQVGDARENGS